MGGAASVPEGGRDNGAPLMACDNSGAVTVTATAPVGVGEGDNRQGGCPGFAWEGWVPPFLSRAGQPLSTGGVSL